MHLTKASLNYKAIGNLRAIQILLDHTNFEITVRYLAPFIEFAELQVTFHRRTTTVNNLFWPGLTLDVPLLRGLLV